MGKEYILSYASKRVQPILSKIYAEFKASEQIILTLNQKLGEKPEMSGGHVSQLGIDIAPQVIANIEMAISNLKETVSSLKNLQSELKRGKGKTYRELKY